MTKYDPERWRAAFAAFMAGRDLKPYKWARDADAGENTVKNFLEGPTRSPTLAVLESLAAVLRIPVSQLLSEIEQHLPDAGVNHALTHTANASYGKTDKNTEENPVYEALIRMQNRLDRLEDRLRRLEEEKSGERAAANPS